MIAGELAKAVRLLVVDDDEVDQRAIERSFRKRHIANPITRARDGVEALEILRGEDGEELGRPFIILLDLRMPRMGGLEFLEELRADPKLRSTVVFVLTTSDDEKDILSAYDRNIAGYIVKSRASEDFMNLIEMIDMYWKVVELP